MKKFLKVLLIIILIAASVGGATFLFFRHVVKSKNSYAEISEFLNNSGDGLFVENVTTINKYAQQDRFNEVLYTNSQLKEIAVSLSGYIEVGKTKKFSDHAVCKKLDKLISIREEITPMREEYVIKCEGASSEEYNRQLGANDVYDKMAEYLVQYSAFLSTLYSELDKTSVDKSADAKFPIYEIYLNVVNTKCSTNFPDEDLIFLNANLDIKNGTLRTNDYSGVVNTFIEKYNKCDKSNFANNIKEYSQNADRESGNGQLVTAWYFNKLLGL